MPLTPEAKKLLAETIRAVRTSLLRAVHDEADRRYRLSVPLATAGLDEAHRRRRERIEAWIDERARAAKPKNKTELAAAQARLLAQAEKEAAATLVNRLVLLRHAEALGLSKPAVLTGGWSSKGYREFREFAPTLCTNGTSDATEGYQTLLQLLFDELAQDLPGLFGDVGLTRLFPIPAATLRDVVERLDDPALASAWTDDTTLGWVYQYWNDPDREALDAKINGGGKIEPHEIASKTQMFTERYMVEWLLQNSLGLTWLSMCKKHGWAPDADRVLPALDARRAEWRKKRDAGEVALDALMPIEGELEEHWKYYVPQPIPEDAVEKAPARVREIKLLDPACGSGHFLVIAFDLLAAIYREEARHTGREIGDRTIAESILENNLHGIDIDPRAIQLAAAGLYLKAKTFARGARPKRLNLVAPVLQLGNLPADDPAVALLRKDLKEEAGIPEELTTRLLAALAGVDYLGSLLKVDAAVEDAIKDVELEFEKKHGQGDLFGGFPAQQVRLSIGEAKATILDKLEQFLARHSRSEDLGLRLDGEQIAAGVRFVRMAREGTYDIVVGNPPYQGTSKTNSFGYVATHYPRGKADLYAAFLERGLQFTRAGGMSALLTMRGWMFLSQFEALRKHLLKNADLGLLADVDRGAFEDVPDEVLATVLSVVRRGPLSGQAVALQPTPPTDRSRDGGRTARKRAAVLAQVGTFHFQQPAFAVIEGAPIVYWWNAQFLARYADAPKLGDISPARFGLNTGNNLRFLRRPWELPCSALTSVAIEQSMVDVESVDWSRFMKGAAGRAWIDPCDEAIRWRSNGVEVKVLAEHLYGSYSRQIRNERVYWQPGVAFTMIGSSFAARAHRFRCVIDSKGSSVYPVAPLTVAQALCFMNRREARDVLSSLNPTISFQVGDVNRLPIFPVAKADEIVERVRIHFGEHEAGRETSTEFRSPRASAWEDCQRWAGAAVDRADDAPLPTAALAYEALDPTQLLSFAVGITLGRFGVSGEGVLPEAAPSALRRGLLFLSAGNGDSLEGQAYADLNLDFAPSDRSPRPEIATVDRVAA